MDKDSGIVHSVEVTSANVHDVEVTPKLLTGGEDTVNGDSGYIGAEKRAYNLLTGHAWEYEWEKWTNLNGIGMVKSLVFEKDTVREDIRCFITSLTDIEEFAYAVRKHLAIENQLHWNLDVIF